MAVEVASFGFESLQALKGPFDGVDANGCVFLPVRLGMAGRIPVWACFSSGCTTASPVLGHGWRIPLLESRLVPISEDWFSLLQPDGTERCFRRERENPERLYGGRTWSGRIKGDVIRLTADPQDGTAPLELVYRQGRLVRMDAPEGLYEFFYAGRAIEHVTLKGAAVVRVTPDGRDANLTTLQIGSARLVCRRANAMLRVSAESGERAERATLVELKRPDGVKTFAYSDDGVTARLTAGTIVAEWDVSSGAARRVSGWRFAVTPVHGTLPRIVRTDPDGRREAYSQDDAKGLRTFEEADGTVHTWRRFTSGTLVGKVRSYERACLGVVRERVELSYDEQRRIVYCLIESREGAETVRTERWFDASGRMTRERKSGGAS